METLVILVLALCAIPMAWALLKLVGALVMLIVYACMAVCVFILGIVIFPFAYVFAAYRDALRA